LVCGDRVVTDAYWGLRTLFRVYVGITNKVDSRYDNICWFPQGVFLITDFSNTYDESGLKINITGKDKMTRLNGDCGGVLPVNLNIDELGVEGLKQKAKIYDIIREAVHIWGQEPYHNIIINDVPNNAYNILEYRVSNKQIQILEPNESENYYRVGFTDEPRNPVNQIYGYGDTVGYQFTDFVYPGTKAATAGQSVT
jgi:hypothetical protein